MTVLEVEVTQYDIDHGVRASAYLCPVARAINRATGKFCLVDGSWVLFQDDQMHGKLPEVAQTFVQDFDFLTDGWKGRRGHTTKVAPFKFSVEVEDIIPALTLERS